MTIVRHIAGPNLKELEKTLKDVKSPIHILGVSNVSGQWYIHFLVQKDLDSEIQIKTEQSFGTKTLKKGK